LSFKYELVEYFDANLEWKTKHNVFLRSR